MTEIIYLDDNYAAINKPHGLLTHPSAIAIDADETAMQWLRNKLDQYVYPVHRLDRKTGGVLLFALDKETLKITQSMFAENAIKKKYLAIVRGYTDDVGIVDYPVRNESGIMREALTKYITLNRSEIDVPFGKFETSRYSLIMAKPETGRMHQLRIHFSHILHPIIGDRPYGCNKQNRLFKERWSMTTMLLHAQSLEFKHPIEGSVKKIIASPQPEFLRMVSALSLGMNQV